ncbi:hypothetical protein PT974_05086 [Cladobotryum mycophilum]|uniref:Uncharacterized protein n=1 Tax=Cladobotryum mycophilum TaxID=491253 RepID=A0ABR0SRQ1_9HYPO
MSMISLEQRHSQMVAQGASGNAQPLIHISILTLASLGLLFLTTRSGPRDPAASCYKPVVAVE